MIREKWIRRRKRHTRRWCIAALLMAAGFTGGGYLWNSPDQGMDRVLAAEGSLPDDAGAGEMRIEGFVQDDAGLLSADEEAKLEEECAGIFDRHQTAAYIITTPDFGAGDIKDWQREVFAGSSLGKESAGSGVMLAVSMAERDWGLVGFGAAQEAFTTYGRELIGERILEDLSDGEYYDAFSRYLSMADEYLAAAKEGRPYTEDHPYGQGWRIPVIIGVSFLLSLAVSSGIVLSWKKSMNTRVPKEGAMEYMKEGSFRLYNRTDQFLYHTISQTKRPEQDSSSGSSMHSDHSGTSGKF